MGKALSRSRVVVLTGPRQCGKTTLARQLQRRPNIFPLLRVLADRRDNPARFLILGSASGDLLRQTSESLAGRMERVTIGGFSLKELGAEGEQNLWLRGGLPLSYLARSEADSRAWRKDYIQALLERDFPQWGVRVPSVALLRFWTMLAHYHGQTWNAAEPARAMGVSESTARRHLDLFTDALVVRQLHPYHANIRKRQVKAPKIYIRDPGLLHQLLGIGTLKELLRHPKLGASWEGFVNEQVLTAESHDEAFFWSTHQGAEIDLILRRGDKLLSVECKRTDSPRLTPSIRIALEDVGLSRVAVLYPGTKRFPITDKVQAIPVQALEKRNSLFKEAVS